MIDSIDNDLSKNVNGMGSGFVDFSGLSSSSLEIDSILQMTAGTVTEIWSQKRFQFFNDFGLAFHWHIGGSAISPAESDGLRYLFVVDAGAPEDEIPNLFPEDDNDLGIYVRIRDQDRFEGGLIIADGTQSELLASWGWESLWDGSTDLRLDLELDNKGYKVIVNNIPVASGAWSESSLEEDFSFSWRRRSPGAIVGAALKNFDDAFQIQKIDRIFVKRKAPVLEVGPQEVSFEEFNLNEGDWTISVRVDDNPDCTEISSTNVCSTQFTVVPEPMFIRGDTNGDGNVNIADASYLLSFLFIGGPPSPCSASEDVSGDGTKVISEASYLLNFLFLNGQDPKPPFPECGFGTFQSDIIFGCDQSPLICQ